MKKNIQYFSPKKDNKQKKSDILLQFINYICSTWDIEHLALTFNQFVKHILHFESTDPFLRTYEATRFISHGN